MHRNMGTADRVVRAAVAAPLLLVLALVVANSTLIGVALVTLAGVMLLTAAVGFCPLYVPLGFDTCSERAPRAQ
ncbi:DUF2892 domain-containing protein [Svornostia abyssi]|uniref:DUF2892 domain-containing protein n=1 Tax=Svornostia abyssi TaxID=2898438 RepID=A0ABY5PHX5_9ACTN|nr:DUF2892 domain-containing protein [Parviterribacteraceae bacterium J379]